MNESYKELLVKRDKGMKETLIRFVSVLPTVFFGNMQDLEKINSMVIDRYRHFHLSYSVIVLPIYRNRCKRGIGGRCQYGVCQIDHKDDSDHYEDRSF